VSTPVAKSRESTIVQIDGTWVSVPSGINAIEAARMQGKEVPHFCYHPKLQVAGNCRMCLIEVGLPKSGTDKKPILGADGFPEIGWSPRPQIGCATVVTEGMAFRTDSPALREARKGVMEFCWPTIRSTAPSATKRVSADSKSTRAITGRHLDVSQRTRLRNPSACPLARASCSITSDAFSVHAVSDSCAMSPTMIASASSPVAATPALRRIQHANLRATTP